MSRRQLIGSTAATLFGAFALAFVGALLVAAPAAGQTTGDTTPTDPTTTTAPDSSGGWHHHHHDPPPTTAPDPTTAPATSPPATSPPTTRPRVFFPPPTTRARFVPPTTATKPATKPATTVAPSAAPAGSSAKSTTTSRPSSTTTKGRSGGGGVTLANGADAAAQAQVADPASPPAGDPLVQVAGRETTRRTAAEKLLSNKGFGGPGDGIGEVLLIGVIAVLPIVGAIALGGFGDTRRWLRRAVHRDE